MINSPRLSVLLLVSSLAFGIKSYSAAAPLSGESEAPAIANIAPSSLTAGSPTTRLTLAGTGFVSGAKVLWNGTTLATTFVNATTLKATVPAPALAGSSEAEIVVQNPGPGEAASEAVVYFVESPAPVIASLTPSQVSPGKAATITIAGSGFEANSVVDWQSSARPTTFVSPTSLKVALTAADLKSQGSGALTVSNPEPGAAVSQGVFLSIVSGTAPMIQSVSIAPAPGITNQCQQLEVTVTGQNFSDFGATIQANGATLQQEYGSTQTPTSVSGYLPLGFVSRPGALTFTVTVHYPDAIVSQPFAYPASAGPIMTLCGSSSVYTPAVYSGSSFAVTVLPSEVNIAANGRVTLGTLPPGFTAAGTSAVLPPTGTVFRVDAGTGAKPGSYSLVMNGTAGGATAAGQFNFTVASGTPPGFNLTSYSLQNEVGIPIGGSTQFDLASGIQFSPGAPPDTDYYVTPYAGGLPAGVAASFSPAVFVPGGNLTVTFTAAANAPVTHNASITIVGKPSAKVPAATFKLTAFVSQPTNELPGSRTDFVSTAGTPYAAAYDSAHDLIFASVPDWNRVDVISGRSHKILKSIPVRSPRGIDVTPNAQSVWVQTASPYVFEIDTTTLQAESHILPTGAVNSSGTSVQFASDRLLALSDGTVFLYFNESAGDGGSGVGVWNPKTGNINVLTPQGAFEFGIPARSGDGKQVYAAYIVPNSNGVEHYDVVTGKLTEIGSGEFWNIMAVNYDGTRLITGPGGYTQPGIYDQNLKRLASLPGSVFDNSGGAVFSADSSQVYVVAPQDSNNLTDVLFTVDASTYKVTGTAPSTGATGIFAADTSGMIFAVATYGISFDDAANVQHFGAFGPDGADSAFGVFDGPLTGGGVFDLYTPPALAPSVWFGSQRGTVSIGNESMTFLAPPSATPGPVNVRMNFPDGSMWLYPQEFGYGTDPEYAVTSGSSPEGGASAEIIGYGLPQDADSGVVTVGGIAATVTTTQGQYPPYSGEPFPSTKLDFTLPPGQPGWADIEVSTPIGFGALPRSVLYAKSVTDYATHDTLLSLFVDTKRDRVYAGAGDHIDVFSIASHEFLTAMRPAGQAGKSFTGMALTPGGDHLLVADFNGGALAVIDPDLPSSTYSIPIPNSATGGSNCPNGPLFVAATSDNLAWVVTGGEPGPACPSSGTLYIVNLKTQTVTMPGSAAYTNCGIDIYDPYVGDAFSVEASGDGNYLAIGSSCVYSAKNASYTGLHFGVPLWDGIAISFDGNVIASYPQFADISGNLLGTTAIPYPLYPLAGGYGQQPQTPMSMIFPRLNESGGLFYVAYPNWFEIIDVPHGLLRMRFALTETVQGTASPMAIDSGGRYVFLITDKGLTEVDLGAPPLSIGHLSVPSAAPGTVVTVRGSGFQPGMTATVGRKDATVSVTDQNTLTLTVPDAANGPQDIVLTLSGGESYTLENGITVL